MPWVSDFVDFVVGYYIQAERNIAKRLEETPKPIPNIVYDGRLCGRFTTPRQCWAFFDCRSPCPYYKSKEQQDYYHNDPSFIVWNDDQTKRAKKP